PTTKVGSWLDVNGIRFVGAGYLGAATPHKVRQIVQKLEPARTHVLLLHAGPDYFVGEGGGFSTRDLELIHDKVCYLALGHIHKPMIHGDWACNPGSPENCGLREARYDRDTAVDLKLIGSVNLNRIAFDLEGLERNIEQVIRILAVGIDASAINLGPTAGSGPGQEIASREEIERSAIRSLVDVEHLWGLEG